MRRRVVLTVVLGGLLALGFLALRGCGVDDGGSGADPEAPDADTTTGGRERGPSRTSSAASSDSGEAESESGAAHGDSGGSYLTTGTVRWPDGSPASDALVVIGDIDDASEDETSWTDATGRFGFDVMPSYSQVYAVARRDGEQWRGQTDVDGGPFDVTVDLRRTTASQQVLLVHVVGHDGGAIDRAVVEVASGVARVRPRGDGELVCHAANGWFVVRPERWDTGWSDGDIFPPEVCFIVHSARDRSGAPMPYGPMLVEIDIYADDPIEVRLPPGRTVAGLVVDANGDPVVGAEVVMDPPTPDGFDSDHMGNVKLRAGTGSDGRYVFHGLADGGFHVETSPEAGRHAGSERVCVAEGDAPPPLVLRREIDVRIRAVDESGRPIDGALYHALGRPSARTGRDGIVRLPQIAEGETIQCTVSCADRVTERIEDWQPAPGEVRSVALQPAFRISGVVLGPDAVPLRGVNVLARRTDGWDRAKWTEDGRFEVRGLRADTRVMLEARDDSRLVLTESVLAGRDDVVLRWPVEDRFTLYVEGGSVSNVALHADGVEVARASSPFSIVSFDPATLPPFVDLLIRPNDDGRSALLRRVPTRGFHRVALTRGEWLGVKLTVPDDVDARLAECRAVLAGGFHFVLPLVGSSTYALDGLPRGRYELTVELGPRSARRSIDLQDHLTLDIDLTER